ncbi:hypothetical protein HA066_25115, partial [Escherichia coli]|nr:hypothetical protein [Escherichia coli]
VLADADRLRRFTSFVNAPEIPDPSITFVTERGQPVPVGGHSSDTQGRQPVTLGLPEVRR